jgi:hypothetical protein
MRLSILLFGGIQRLPQFNEQLILGDEQAEFEVGWIRKEEKRQRAAGEGLFNNLTPHPALFS